MRSSSFQKDKLWKYKLEHCVKKFYESDTVKDIIDQITQNDKPGNLMTLYFDKKLVNRQVEFLNLIKDLRYIRKTR